MTLPASFRDCLALPVIASPMFIASTPELVIEQCKAGIVGSFLEFGEAKRRLASTS